MTVVKYSINNSLSLAVNVSAPDRLHNLACVGHLKLAFRVCLHHSITFNLLVCPLLNFERAFPGLWAV